MNLADFARALGVPTGGLIGLTITARQDRESTITATFECSVGDERLSEVVYLVRDRGLLETTRVVRCPWGSIELDTGAAYREGGRLLRLTPRERGVLLALASRAGRFVSQREIATRTWGPEYADDTHYVRGVVLHLREKLGDSKPFRFIQSQTGGYVLTVAP